MRVNGIGWLVFAGAAAFASGQTPATGSPEVARIAVVSAAIAEVTPSEGATMTMLHVRVALTNPTGEVAWRFDPRATRIDLGRDGETRPALVNGEIATLPIVLVEPGAQVTLDLFAALPARVTAVDRFAVRARIATPDRRFTVVAGYDRSGWMLDEMLERGAPIGAATRWWADPRFPWTTFQHRSGPITVRPPALAAVAVRDH